MEPGCPTREMAFLRVEITLSLAGIIFAAEYFTWMVLLLKFVLTLGFGLVILALL